MRRGFALGVVVWSVLAAAHAQAVLDSPARAIDPARLEALVDGAVGQALHAEPIAGVTVAVVDREGVLLAKGYGRATPDRAADDATLFRVGSISKTFVWIALLQLVEQGAIGLDDPVNERLPEALRVPDDGFAEPIRVRHLMTHSAGFEDSILGHLFVARAEEIAPLAEYLATHRVRRVRVPGQLAVYSNYGAALAGALVAQVSGLRWEDYAEQRILRPLGMASATYREPYSAELARTRGLPEPMPADVAARLSAGWSIEAGRAVAQTTEFVSHVAPAGSMSADARDMAAYMQALLDPARMEQAGVLRAATALALREPLFANVEGLAPLRHGFLDYRVPGGSLAFGHDGGLVYQHARLIVAPELGLGVFFAINTAAGGALHDGLCALIVRELFGAGELPVARYDGAPAAAQSVAGTYLGLRRPYFRTERALMAAAMSAQLRATPEGDLIVPSGPGQPARRYVPLGGARWGSPDGLAEIAFVERDGRMLAFDSLGVMPFERLRVLDRPIVWLALLGVADVVVLAALVGLLRGRRRRREQLVSGPTGSGLPYVAAILVWTAALVLLAAGVAPLLSPGAAVYRYPGTLLPIACWALAAAALATAIALVAFALGVRGEERGRAWRASGLTLLALCSVALWRAGLLGFSGW